MVVGHRVTRFEDAGILRDADLPSDTRMTCILLARRNGPVGPVVELLALLEGLDDAAVGRFLLRWNLRQGLPASVLGGPFALRLPILLARVGNPDAARFLGNLRDTDGLVLQGTALEGWQALPAGEAAAAPHAEGAGSASVRVAAPSRADLECWEALRLAADVGGLPTPAETAR